MAQMKDILRDLRNERDAKQSTIAIDLSISRGTYSSYENGITPPTETCIRIAEYFGVSLEYLLGLSNERRPAGGKLAAALAGLAGLAGKNAPTASEILAVIEAATDYYHQGAPCGDLPLQALRGFLSGLGSALEAAGKGDAPALLAAANAATVAALEVTKMPPALYESKYKK